MNSNLDPRQWRSWEVDPSTRQSVKLFERAIPVDVTLATPGTAENLVSLSSVPATVNLITNPSFETASPPTSFTAVGSTLSRVNTQYLYGSYSMQVIPNNAAKGEGAYYSLGSFAYDTPLSCSAYLRRAAGSGGDARVELYGVTSAARLAVGNTITLGASWARSQLISPIRKVIHLNINTVVGTFLEDAVVTGGTSGATATIMSVTSDYLIVTAIAGEFRRNEAVSSGAVTAILNSVTHHDINEDLRLYIVSATQHAITYFVDGAQAEVLDSPTAFCDGDQGLLHQWDGTAHASTSRRYRSMGVIKGFNLFITRDAYVAFGRDASSTATLAKDKGVFRRAGTDWWSDHPRIIPRRISFINSISGEQPRIYGEVLGGVEFGPDNA